MDCFQILLLLLLAGCSNGGNACRIAQQTTSMKPDDCACQAVEEPGTVISRMERDQAAPYPFPPYPVLRE